MVVLDNVQYKVRVKVNSLGRSFRIDEGDRSGTVKSGYYFRDIIGTYYDYSMEIESDPTDPADYDAFYQAISAPVDSHTLTVPYGQTTMTYNAMVTSGNDMFKDKVGSVNRWTGLSVQFTAIEPQRRPT